MQVQLKHNASYYFDSLEEEKLFSNFEGIKEMSKYDYFHAEENGYNTEVTTWLHLKGGQIFDFIKEEEDSRYSGGAAYVLKLNGVELKISKSLLKIS